MNEKILDVIGVGIGPFNLGLACLSDPIEELDCLFFDAKPSFDWHPGIMPEWSTLQIPFIADLVTFSDPTSPYSFLNYLKEKGRIYQYYIRESLFIFRKEYNEYCKWAAEKLNTLKFSTEVIDLNYKENDGFYEVYTRDLQGKETKFLTRNIVLGTGTTPIIPDFCKGLRNLDTSANYLSNKERYKNSKSVTIIGSGQSGAEIYYDLLQSIDDHDYELNWYTRSDRIYSMDLGKLTLEFTSPDYKDFFFKLPRESKDRIVESQSSLYKGVNLELINSIYDSLYMKSIASDVRTNISPCSELKEISELGTKLELKFSNVETQECFNIETEYVVLALGYEYQIPKFLGSILPIINWDCKERLDVSKSYTIDKHEKIFVQNVGLYSHGMTVPDLGMGCHRNSIIINEILKKEVYKVEDKICFQTF